VSRFDFITVQEFRESLESDYVEMRGCAQAQAWKSVQVLAGSIVESLLIDYLAATRQREQPGKDPLKLDLGEAISICRGEKVLSDRTADLCSVIRSYRNLIHPGRLIRLGEQAPNEGSATIALALVDLITDELARVRRATVGLTAEQILSKLQRDANSLPLLKHLLQEVSENQRERLLLELIPNAYLQAPDTEDPFAEEDAERLERAYRVTLETVPDQIRKRVGAEFVRILREEDGHRVLKYSAGFVRPSDLQHVPKQHQAMVREHLLGRVSNVHTNQSLQALDGIAEYLEPTEVQKWVDPFVRTLISSSVPSAVKTRARKHFVDATLRTTTDVDVAIDGRLDAWIKHLENGGSAEQATVVRQLKDEIDSQRVPF
jgi:hypothetical protein